MKKYLAITIAFFFYVVSVSAQTTDTVQTKFYIDVHHFAPGSVSFEDVAEAHAKDLATEDKYGVKFIQYWVDDKKGDVYCLSSAADTGDIIQTHREAHGLLPQEIYQVSDGVAAAASQNSGYFLDIHYFGAGQVTAADVAKAHQKDLAVEDKYGVKFINYWVDEKKGVVFCLSQAGDASKVIQTHKEAHGLIPNSIVPVQHGN